GSPDMRVPIAHALGWPERIASGAQRLNLLERARLDFEAPDIERFPALRLAEQAARKGGTLPAVLNAANEAAVAAFLDGRLAFSDIPVLIEEVMDSSEAKEERSLEEVLQADTEARRLAEAFVARAVRTGTAAAGQVY
ncbi:MAG: 1-deoxy-D-xylulose-5-phosphate reductoisomerase, partial [Pseudomonadota bacterium]|nr:1-deoxy-D-xylulose-5-phosphate reductoisomerase [Pseudomonadota bacterium]